MTPAARRAPAGLDRRPSDAELLRMKADREAKRGGAAPVIVPDELPAITWPIRLRLPWSLLVSDNEKYGVINGRMLITSRYRQAKATIAARARDLIGEVEPARHPVALEALVWVPDNRPHDVPNFGKCVHDALEGVVYVKDSWLHGAHWKRAGVDVDSPRAEITITPHA